MEKKEKSRGGGVSSFFSIEERKEILRKYLYFLGWLEVLIFVGCWIYQLGSYETPGAGPVDIPFPWKAYFALAFLAPIATTFIIGTILVGFNRYFGEGEIAPGPAGSEFPEEAESSEKIRKLYRIVRWFHHVPFLGLLLLLGMAVGFFYKLDTILALIGTFGEQTIKAILILLVSLLALVSCFAMILILLNYRLRKRAMEYQFRSEMAEKFGLIILEDNTVIDRNGRLLIQGKKWKKALPSLATAAQKGQESPESEQKSLPYAPGSPHVASAGNTE
ncbi:hypothetical protein [Thermodesulforhabdus norvegica]|uniref:Uncharacterized protein n=1 Tax=Thermodesulforhabdus norvegica TaxID=39841 RepID=A0A1I4UJ75_9BACT|nr:hypothetical protein [Thermodesulforhabdus norvegica]SFM89008.1 hypothetical protein SAMN05660836_01830 [Thermodesulforhabdus norvegica]